MLGCSEDLSHRGATTRASNDELAGKLECIPTSGWVSPSRTRCVVHRTDYLRDVGVAVRFISAEPLLGPLEGLGLDGIDWQIAGGESRHRHRPVREDWLLDLRDRCPGGGDRVLLQAAGRSPAKSGGWTLDNRTWDDMPAPGRLVSA